MATIEYFYAAYSAYAYLGSARFLEIARAAGRTVEHRPIQLRRVVDAGGGIPFAKRSPARQAYFFGREMQRWSEFREAPMIGHRPTHHDASLGPPDRLLIAAMRQGTNVDDLSHALLSAHWREDADLADPETLRAIAARVGIDAGPLLAAAEDPEVAAVLEANTEEAIARNVFGSPTYFVDGDMFYGQDHLEMIERALRQPFKGAPAAETAS